MALINARLFAREQRAHAAAEAARNREGMRLLGAQGAGVGLLDPDGERFRFNRLLGAKPESAAAWQIFPNHRAIPYGEAAATKRVLCLSSHAAVAERFPAVASDLQRRGSEALVVLPLVGSDGVVLAAAHLAFAAPHEFGPTEVREFEDLAQECAQALERARAYEAERAARTHGPEHHRRDRDDDGSGDGHGASAAASRVRSRAWIMPRTTAEASNPVARVALCASGAAATCLEWRSRTS